MPFCYLQANNSKCSKKNRYDRIIAAKGTDTHEANERTRCLAFDRDFPIQSVATLSSWLAARLNYASDAKNFAMRTANAKQSDVWKSENQIMKFDAIFGVLCLDRHGASMENVSGTI